MYGSLDSWFVRPKIVMQVGNFPVFSLLMQCLRQLFLYCYRLTWIWMKRVAQVCLSIYGLDTCLYIDFMTLSTRETVADSLL